MQTEMLFPELEELLRKDGNDNENGDKANNKQHIKGMLAELLFDCLGELKKWQVNRPTSGFLKYDRIAIIDGEYKKIQIKSAYDIIQKSGNISKTAIISRNRSSKRHRGKYLKYKKGDYDLLFIPSMNYCWLIPFEAIENKCAINLYNDRWDEFKICRIEDIFKIL